MTASPPAQDDGKWSWNQDPISEIDFHYMALGVVSLRFLADFRSQGSVRAAKTNSFLRNIGEWPERFRRQHVQGIAIIA